MDRDNRNGILNMSRESRLPNHNGDGAIDFRMTATGRNRMVLRSGLSHNATGTARFLRSGNSGFCGTARSGCHQFAETATTAPHPCRCQHADSEDDPDEPVGDDARLHDGSPMRKRVDVRDTNHTGVLIPEKSESQFSAKIDFCDFHLCAVGQQGTFRQWQGV